MQAILRVARRRRSDQQEKGIMSKHSLICCQRKLKINSDCISVKESYLFVPCILIRASNPEHHTHNGQNLCFIRAFDPLTLTLFSYGRILHALWYSQNFCSPGFFVSKPTPQQWHNSAGLGPKRATFWKGPLKIGVSFGPREGSYSI